MSSSLSSSSSPRQSIGQDLCYYLVMGIVKGLGLLPFCLLYLLSDLLYPLCYYIIRYRRRVVRSNLTSSFPSLSLKEIITIERQFYHFFLDIIVETCKMSTLSAEEMQRHMPFANTEALHEALRAGRSVAVYLGHYGNWEWIASTGLWFPETTIAQIYHKLNNATMDRVLRQIRERMGNICVERHDTVRFMATQHAQHYPQVIGFLADQSPRKRDAKYFLPFLHHRVPVTIGTEKAAKHYGYAAMFISTKRVRRGYYECTFVPLYDDTRTIDDYEVTRRFYEKLEEEIIAAPAYYLWTHKRFKFAK